MTDERQAREDDRRSSFTRAGGDGAPEESPQLRGQAGSGDSLMQFRTTWLRAVAHAWINPAFHEELRHNPIRALQVEFGFKWPWRGLLKLKVRVEESFLWVGDDWVWPSDKSREEGIVLYVPLKPPTGIRDDQHAIALSDYYQKRPSLLSMGSDDFSNAMINTNSFNINRALANVLADGSRVTGPLEFSALGPQPTSLIPSPSSLLDFQVVLISVMAKAWRNKNFRDLIQQSANVTPALQTIRGYSAPWRLNLSIRDDDTATWDSRGGWDDLSIHELLLHLPVAPQQANEQALALATYNSTGSQFFFSCCA